MLKTSLYKEQVRMSSSAFWTSLSVRSSGFAFEPVCLKASSSWARENVRMATAFTEKNNVPPARKQITNINQPKWLTSRQPFNYFAASVSVYISDAFCAFLELCFRVVIIYEPVAKFLENLVFGLVHFLGAGPGRIVETEVVEQGVGDVKGQFCLA